MGELAQQGACGSSPVLYPFPSLQPLCLMGCEVLLAYQRANTQFIALCEYIITTTYAQPETT